MIKRLWVQLLPLTKLQLTKVFKSRIQVTKVFKSRGEFKPLSLIFLDHEPSHAQKKKHKLVCFYTPIEPRYWIWGNQFALKSTKEVI